VNCGTQADRDRWQIDGIPQSGFDVCYANEFAESSEDGFVPKLSAAYTIDEDKMIFATYSEGFRSGGANSGKKGSVYGIDGQFHTFDSDTLLNYELGFKSTWADGRFQFNITAYHMVWEDIQIEAIDTDAAVFASGIVNFAEAEIDGFEADFSWIPAENWELSGVLGYNDAALSEDSVLFPDGDDPKTAVKGTRLPLVPDWKAALTAQYTFPQQLWGAEPYLLGVYQYQGDSVNSLEGISSTLGTNPVRTHPSYSLFNLRFGLNSGSWSASIYVDYVFNEYGINLFNDRWIKTRVTVTRPRTIGINYRYTWN